MVNAFGVDHEVAKAARDYSRAEARWAAKERRANRVENAAQGTAGGAGAVLGLAALRDAGFKDHPTWKPAMGAKLKPLGTVGRALTEGKPGFKTLAVATGATGTAVVAGKKKRRAEKKHAQYATMNKSYPLSDQVQDLVKGITPNPNSPASIKRHKKAQGILGTTAATTGLLALGTKTGAKALPKLLKAPAKAASYQAHLDRTANALLFAGAGIGGASGLHQSRIYAAEGAPKHKKVKKNEDCAPKLAPTKSKAKKLARHGLKVASWAPMGDTPRTLAAKKIDQKLGKAFDPDRAERHRARAAEVTGGVAAAGLAGMAARPTDRGKSKAAYRAQQAGAKAKLRQGLEGMNRANQARREIKALEPKKRGLAAAQARNTGNRAAIHVAEGAKGLLAEAPKLKPALRNRAGYAAGAAGAAGLALAARHHRKTVERKPLKQRDWYSG